MRVMNSKNAPYLCHYGIARFSTVTVICHSNKFCEFGGDCSTNGGNVNFI